MKMCARIVAEHAGDADEPQDRRWKVVFVGVLKGKVLIPREYFGYALEVNENDVVGKWPFCMGPPSGGRGAFLDFGAGCDERPSEINIFEKELELGALFSRLGGAGAGTYRIVAITDILENDRN